MIRIELPLPPRELHPNARVHWAQKARRTRAYRSAAHVLAIRAMREAVRSGSAEWPGLTPSYEAATCRICFHFPSARNRDKDGLLAWMKAGIDGIADAGVVENDAGFTFPPVEVEVDKKNPRVVLEVTPL